MGTAKFQQLSEGAIFLFEPRLFTTTVIAYDHRVANQTVIASWGTGFEVADEVADEYAVSEEPSETPETPDWRAYPTLPYDD